MKKSDKNESYLEDLDKLKWVAKISIVLAICLLGAFFFATHGQMSQNPNDWAAFGSFLSGIFSFLGAVGTVGVMLLGIKQFKVQQAQIDAQTQRQEDFETKQHDKWEKENEMLNFQKYLLHVSEFNSLLKGIETEHYIKFKNKHDLYYQLFPNNNPYQTTFSIDSSKQSLVSILENFLNQLVILDHKYRRSPTASDFKNMIGLVSSIYRQLDFEFLDSESDDTKQTYAFDIKIKKVKAIIDIGAETVSKLSQLSSFELKFKHISAFKNKAFINDAIVFSSSHGSLVNGSFLEFLMLLQAAIKHSAAEYPELLSLSQYKFKSIDLNYMNDKHDKYRKLVQNSNLKPDEMNLLLRTLLH